MRDYEPYYTEDGSIGLYSFADKDVYHSKFGALTEAWEKGKIKEGDLVVLASFGSGFTWASAIIRW